MMKKANSILGCTRKATASMWKKVILSLHSISGMLNSVLGLQSKNDMDILEWVQGKTTKTVKGLKYFRIKERPSLSIQNVGKTLPSWHCLLYNSYNFKYLNLVFANLPLYTILILLLTTVLLWWFNPPLCSSSCSCVLPLGREQCLFSAYSDSVWISCTAVIIRYSCRSNRKAA